MSYSRDLLNAHYKLVDTIKEETAGLLTSATAVQVIIGALNKALSADDFRHLQWAIQRKDAPPDPVEEAWVKARVAAENAAMERVEAQLSREG
jgi:hypothetical protein